MDLGCGDGYVAQQILKKKNVSIIGVDLNKQLLRDAEEKLKKEKFSTCCADARKIPLKCRFDVIYSGCILSHVKDPERILDEMQRLGKKGARIIVQIPNDDVLLKIKKLVKTLRLDFLFPGIRMELAKTHLMEFNLKKLKKIISNNFVIKKVTNAGIFTLPVYYIILLQLKTQNIKKKL